MRMLWSPFQELEEFQRRIDRRFGAPRRRTSHGYPPVDVIDTDGQFVILALLPGINKDEIDLEVLEDTITLSGVRERKSIPGARYIKRERGYGNFQKVIKLPEPVAAGKVTAQYTDGILIITLPKARPSGPITITVQWT